MSINLIFNFTGYQKIGDDLKMKIQTAITHDLHSSHIDLQLCHAGPTLVTVNFDLTGIFFNGTVQCSCEKYSLEFTGNTNSSEVNYSLDK